MPDPTRFMTRDEVPLIIKDLHRRAKRSVSSHLNLIIFRLSCCCGLRRSEIAGLRFTDLVLAGARPCITIRKENTKGRNGERRERKVPLWWDSGTLEDLKAWVAFRKEMGARPNDPVVCGVSRVNRGKALTGSHIAKRWKAAIRCLGPERRAQLSVHCGRHTFASLSHAAGHSPVEVQAALGHSSVHTTSLYLHAVPTDVPDVFPV